MSRKVSTKSKHKKKKNNAGKIAAIMVLLLVICAAVVVIQNRKEDDQTESDTQTEQSQVETAEDEADQSNAQAQTEQSEAVSSDVTEKAGAFNLGYGMEITAIEKYAGVYYEAGDDRKVDGVLMIEVTNTGDDYIQYAEITLTGDSGTANFSLSTLYPGEAMVVLEKDMKAYSEHITYTSAEASNVALFSEVPGLCEDKLQIQQLDGAINVINISEEAIDGEIVIYYKNYIDGLLQGGITYRIRISDGLDAGEIRQIMADHFSGTESRIMFVTCG